MKKEEDSLTIFGVAERDQGSYTCVASTELDQDLAKAYLTVLGNGCLSSPQLLPKRSHWQHLSLVAGPLISESGSCGAAR